MNNQTNDRALEAALKSIKQMGSASDSYRTNARIRILNTIPSNVGSPTHRFQWPRFMWYTFGSALATVFISVGTVYASQSSVPNTPLYPLKVLSEKVALTLSPTQSVKTTVASTIISRRITEISELQKQENESAVEESISHFNEDVEFIKKQDDITQDEISRTLNDHKDFIEELKKRDDETRVKGAQKENKPVQPEPRK